MDCRCKECLKKQSWREWLKGEPAPWLTIFLFALAGLFVAVFIR